MGELKIILIVVLGVLFGVLFMYPTSMWAPTELLNWIPEYYHERAIWKAVVQDNQSLWYGLALLSILAVWGYKVVK